MRHCFYHTDLGQQNAVFHNIAIQIAIQDGGAKVQVIGHRSQVRSQVTGHRPQVRLQATGHRSGYRPQVTGHRSGHRSQKTIGHWTKLFWADVLLYKNKISQGTLMVFLSFKQY